MNHEVEAYEGELRQLRERELKLAAVMNAVEELLDRGLENSPGVSSTDELRIDALKRLAWDSDLMAWLDKLRQAGKAPIKRLYETHGPDHSHDEEEQG